MKVGIVVPYYTPYVGGNEHGLATALSHYGDVTILTSTGKAVREKAVTANTAASNSGFHVRYLKTLLDVGELPVTPGIIPRILRDKYDALLLQEDYQPICHLAQATALIDGTPTILSVERNYYPEGLRRIPLGLMDATLNKFVRKQCTVFTSHCTSSKEFMVENFRIHPDRIRVVNVGVDTDTFKPTTTDHQDGFNLFTVARLHPYKGLSDLIAAMATIVKQVPDTMLYIKGRGGEMERLEHLAHNVGVNDHVVFIDQAVPNHEMPSLYSKADVYVQPSIIEPYGIAVLEAMACGLPVVCTRVGGMRDTVADGENGYLVEPRSVTALADRIVQLHNPELRMKMGDASRKRAIEKFDWKVIAASYYMLIKSIT